MAAVILALIGAGALVALGDLRLAVTPAILVMLVWGLGVVTLPRPRWGVWHVLAAALAVRAVLLASPPTLSDDLFRYLWEGRAILLGGNPFATPPADPSWASLAPADPWRQLVNHPRIPTIYPPVALGLFAIVARIWYAPLGFKVVMGLCDALTAWAIADTLRHRRRRLDAAWLYALHPLGAVESAGSGHLEAIAILMLVLAIRSFQRGGSGLGWAGLGGLLKLLPFTLIPALWGRSPWLLALILAVGIGTLLPFWDAGSGLLFAFSNYAHHWSFNASGFAVIELVAGSWARPIAILIGAALSAWALCRRSDPAVIALWVGGCFVLLSPTVHPWYMLWAWVPALLVGVRSWTVLATLAPLSYAALITYDPTTSKWIEPAWPVPVMILPLLAALVVETARHRLRPGPVA